MLDLPSLLSALQKDHSEFEYGSNLTRSIEFRVEGSGWKLRFKGSGFQVKSRLV